MTDDDKLIDSQGNVDEDELDRRIREMGLDQSPSVEAKAKGDKIDDEFGERLRALENKARTHKLIRDNRNQETERKQLSDGESARGLGVGLSVAYTIIGLPLAGVVIGWLVDQRLGTQTFRSLGVLLGSVFGIAAALLILSRSNRQG